MNYIMDYIKNLDKTEILCNILLSVSFASFFICIFFFTYAKDVEKQIVVNNLVYLVDTCLSKPIAILKSYSLYNTDNLSQMKPDEHDFEDDHKVAKSNELLWNMSIKYIGSMMIISILVVLIICFIKKNNKQNNFSINQTQYIISVLYYFSKIIFKNMLMVTGIGLTEYIFLNYVAAEFMAADANILIKQIIINLIKIINEMQTNKILTPIQTLLPDQNQIPNILNTIQNINNIISNLSNNPIFTSTPISTLYPRQNINNIPIYK